MRSYFGKLFLFFVALAMNCGGGDIPAADCFSTVCVDVQAEHGIIEVDLINYALDNDVCTGTIPAAETQNLIIRSIEKLPKPPNVPGPYQVKVDSFQLSYVPVVGNLDDCFNRFIPPTGIYTVDPGQTLSIPIPVVSQEIKECLLGKYSLGHDPACRTARIVFPDFSSFYKVYGVLTFRVTEYYSGDSKIYRINFGTYILGDYTRQ